MACDSRRALTAVAWALVISACPALAAAASPENRAAARQHYNQADQLRKRGQLAEACKQLEEVERLDPKLPTLIELAECTEQTGKVVEAQAFWQQARDRAKHDEKPQSRARAETRLAALQKRIAQLTLQLNGAQPGVQVLSDDVTLEPAALAGALPMNPGDHVIVVKLAGHDDAKYAVRLADGEQQTLSIAPGPVGGARAVAAPVAAPTTSAAPAPLAAAPPASASATAAAEPATAPTGWWTGEHTAGVVLGGAGVLAIGGGTVLCVGAQGDTADAGLALGGVALATGGVLLVSGLLLLAGGSSDASQQHARSRVTPTLVLTREVAALGAVGAF